MGARGPAGRWRRAAVGIAAVLAVIGVVSTAARLDQPADPGLVRLGWSSWRSDGVVIDVPVALPAPSLRSGDLIAAIAGVPLTDPPGEVAYPATGQVLLYEVDGEPRPVRMERPSVPALALDNWGNLIFIATLTGLALVLFRRRPDEPSTSGLLVGAAGLAGSSVVLAAGLPALALATGGPVLWLFHVSTVGVYAVGWGGVTGMALLLVPDHPWLRRRRRPVLAVACAGPAAVLALWWAGVATAVPGPLDRLALLHGGTTAVVATTQLVSVVAGLVAYFRLRDPRMRARLRWVAGGAAVSVAAGLAGWLVPELLTGRQLLPGGAIGLAGIPFVVALGVALWRHHLFDIERVVNRSLVYGIVVALLISTYVVLVAVLVVVLRLSDTVAAALAAAVAALALAPLRAAAQRAVNRLMYGDRDDPAGVLADLGARLQSVPLPAEVPPAVVEAVGQSLRVPYVAVDLADGGGAFRVAAERGQPAGSVHETVLVHHGETVGRLRVSDRGTEDPLDAADLTLITSLAQQLGPSVQAVRLHEDLVRSRAALVASREDERRRLRRDLHDGLGPSLAAIGLKAGLAARDVPAGSSSRALLDQIGTEVQDSIADVRRVVDALRPPALDELGLVGALRERGDALSGRLEIDVGGPAGRPADRLVLPAAVETAAYRIAVEAMTNAVKHSRAGRCDVEIELDEAELRIVVRDDGVGLDGARRLGVGLRSMRERAAEVGGTTRVSSSPSGGTLVTAHLPLDLGVQR